MLSETEITAIADRVAERLVDRLSVERTFLLTGAQRNPFPAPKTSRRKCEACGWEKGVTAYRLGMAICRRCESGKNKPWTAGEAARRNGGGANAQKGTEAAETGGEEPKDQ